MERDAIVLNIPHSSTIIPEECRSSFVIDYIDEEMRIMTDWYTDELFTEEGIRSAIAPVSRLVVDTERFEFDEDEIMARVGMGAVYTHSSRGEIMRIVDSTYRQKLIDQYYRPHHAALERAVEQAMAIHGQALVLDCHSFSSVPLPHESDRTTPRPDICIGTDDYHTDPELKERVLSFFISRGYTVAINSPFAGSLVPMKWYGKDKAVQSIMIELNRSLYMDELTLHKHIKGFQRLKDDIGELYEVVTMAQPSVLAV